MKRFLLLNIFLCCFTLATFSQELPDLRHVKLSKKVHYKETEQLVMKVIDYLFNTPIDRKNESRRKAGNFLFDWMNGTPYYVFYLNDNESRFFNTDADLMMMYMAGLAKFTLENKTVENQKEKVKGTYELIIPYLDQQGNKKNWTAELWQLSDAFKRDKLDDFIENEVYK